MRALVLIAALVLAGCSAGQEIRRGGTIPGTSITVATLLPLHGPDADAVRDIIAGEQLALFEAGGQVPGRRVGLAVYDEGARQPAAVTRDAIHDILIGAIIGGLRTRDAARSVPVSNAAGLLHVSPGAPDPALASDPRFEPAGERTFFPLAPDARAQAATMARAAPRGPVEVAVEGGRDARALGDALRAAAGDRLAERARTVLYAGEDVDAAERFARRRRSATIVFGDTLARRGLAERLPDATFVAAVPEEPDADFSARFRERFAREPGPYAVLGHEAMTRVLDAMRAAGDRLRFRQAIVDAYAGSAAAEPLTPRVW